MALGTEGGAAGQGGWVAAAGGGGSGQAGAGYGGQGRARRGGREKGVQGVQAFVLPGVHITPQLRRTIICKVRVAHCRMIWHMTAVARSNSLTAAAHPLLGLPGGSAVLEPAAKAVTIAAVAVANSRSSSCQKHQQEPVLAVAGLAGAKPSPCLRHASHHHACTMPAITMLAPCQPSPCLRLAPSPCLRHASHHHACAMPAITMLAPCLGDGAQLQPLSAAPARRAPLATKPPEHAHTIL